MQKFKTRTALIIESETFVSLQVKKIIEEKGFSVVGIENDSSMVMKVVKETQPSLIICDLFIDGNIDVIDLMKRVKTTSKCQLIVTSKDLNEELSKRISELLPCYYVKKPIEKLEIIDTLDMMFSPMSII